MTLHEPATFCTDLVLAALGACFAVWLRKEEPVSSAKGWWVSSLALMSISALAGGFYHGFAPEFPELEPWWWRVVLWIICGLGFAMGMSLLHELKSPGLPVWRVLLVAKFIAFATAAFFKPAFLVAMADYGSAMIAWLIAAISVRASWRRPMLAGLGLSMLAGFVQQAQWRLHAHFNHNDLFHLIQALALVAFYQAGRRLRPRQSPLSAPRSRGSLHG
jgi:MFS family permease